MEQFIPGNDLFTSLENEFDFDFSVNEKYIVNMQEFEGELYTPFLSGSGKVFYRGERINAPDRPLLPTVLRNRSALFSNDEPIMNITADFLLDYYNRTGIPEFYNRTFGTVRKYRLYEFMAFSQHYYNFSPLIDFTKSLYVALSFALKGRKTFDDDCVIYTVAISNPDRYTDDLTTAECWLNSLNITVMNSPEVLLHRHARGLSDMKELRLALEKASRNASPKANLIDIPTNDLMKFQQGVFLLLDDYRLVSKSYLTKNIRDDFNVTKYVINRHLCPQLLRIVESKAPWYSYDCLLDIKKGISKIR